MRLPHAASTFRLALAALGAAALATALAPAAAGALSNAPGGVRAPSSPQAGGSEYGVLAAAPSSARPTVAGLSVPASAPPGAPPRVLLRIDEPATISVDVRVTVTSLSTRRPVLVVALGWVPTGRTLSVRWPAHAKLAPGVYHVSLTARDPHGATLLRRAHSSGVASLTVSTPRAPARPPAPAPVPQPPAPVTEKGVPTPAQTLADGAVFPVAGAHGFGGPEERFGAPREGHLHQGQDVLTAEGTPVIAPLAGTIAAASYQAGGAGWYLVEHTAIGLDFMFAHCQTGSLAAGEGTVVAPGQALCAAGQTGDATGPHLHFEIWVGGWQAPGGHPIDPLAYLEAWER